MINRALLRATIDAQVSPMLLFSPQLEPLVANRSFEVAFGEPNWKSFDETRDVIHKLFEDPEQFMTTALSLRVDAVTEAFTELRQCWPVKKDWVVQSSPVRDGDGTFLGRLWVFQDRTEERERERELRLTSSELAAQRSTLANEMASGASVQRLLLPSHTPELQGFSLDGRYLPARSLGGDFYDWWQPRPDLLNVVLGDVSGKGVPAAIMMATVRATLRAVAEQLPPHQILRRAAPLLTPALEQSGQFVTLFMAQVDLDSGWVRYVDVGHGLALWRNRGVVRPLVGVRSLPLGFEEGEFQQAMFRLIPGDALVLFSDGLLETDVKTGWKTVETLAASWNPESSTSEVLDSFGLGEGATQTFDDDIAVVVLEALAAVKRTQEIEVRRA